MCLGPKLLCLQDMTAVGVPNILGSIPVISDLAGRRVLVTGTTLHYFRDLRSFYEVKL